MANLFSLVFILVLSTCCAIPIEYDEYATFDSQPAVYSYNENDNSNQNGNWNSNDEASIAADDGESNVSGFTEDDFSSLIDKSKSGEVTVTLVKRDTEGKTQNKFGLSDVIGNVEDSLLSSALQVSHLYKNITEAKVINATAKVNLNETQTSTAATTTTTTTDRNKRETDAEYIASECEDLNAAENITIPTSNSTENKNNTTNVSTVLSHLVAHDVPVTDDKAAHVVVNQLAVYLPQEAHNLPLLPSFGLTLNGEKHAAIKALENKTLANLHNATSAESESASNESDESTTKSSVILTPIIAVSAISKSTQKTPVEQLKDVEKEVKQKAAEVAADPIILSARV